MKKLLLFIALLGGLSGCATPPIYMTDHFQGKKITQCDNDTFCFRESYSVAWDNSCSSNKSGEHNNRDSVCNSRKSSGYPVSYRSKEHVYQNDNNGYAVTLPTGGNIAMGKEKEKGAGNE